MWSVYILRCSDSSLYTGITTDVDRRVREHNAGKGSKYVRSRLPAVLVWHEDVKDRAEASKREAFIKSMRKPDKEKLVLSFLNRQWYETLDTNRYSAS